MAAPPKEILLQRRLDAGFVDLFNLACGKRPQEELYDLQKDPYAIQNVAGTTDYRAAQQTLRNSLSAWMNNTNDPRAAGGGAYEAFDHYPYFGGPATVLGPSTQPAK